MYILVQKEDHLIDKLILHQSTKRSDRKKKKKRNLNMHQLGYKFRISSYLFFLFVVLLAYKSYVFK